MNNSAMLVSKRAGAGEDDRVLKYNVVWERTIFLPFGGSFCAIEADYRAGRWMGLPFSITCTEVVHTREPRRPRSTVGVNQRQNRVGEKRIWATLDFGIGQRRIGINADTRTIRFDHGLRRSDIRRCEIFIVVGKIKHWPGPINAEPAANGNQ